MVAHVRHGRRFLGGVGVVERQAAPERRDQHGPIEPRDPGGHVHQVVVGPEGVVQLHPHGARGVREAEGQRPGRVSLRQGEPVRRLHRESQLREIDGVLAHHQPMDQRLGPGRDQLRDAVPRGQRAELRQLKGLQGPAVVAEHEAVQRSRHHDLASGLRRGRRCLLGGVRGRLRSRGRLLPRAQSTGQTRVRGRRRPFRQAHRVGGGDRLRLHRGEQHVGADHHQHHQGDRHQQAEFSSHRGCRLEEVSEAGAPGRGWDGGTGS